MRNAMVAQYLLLERVNPSDFNKLSPDEQAKVLQNACGDVLNDIATTRQNIIKGKINLMQLAPLVAATNEGLGIQPEQAEWIAQKASLNKNWDTAGKIGLGALALGLGIAATFATGGLAQECVDVCFAQGDCGTGRQECGCGGLEWGGVCQADWEQA
jgi:hypothetical protein